MRETTFADNRPLVARSCRRKRKHDSRRIFLGAVDSLSRLLIVRFLRFEDVGYKFLRIAVDDREPGALDLHHDAMALFENVIRGVQINRERRDRVWRDGFWFFEGFAEAPAENFIRNH